MTKMPNVSEPNQTRLRIRLFRRDRQVCDKKKSWQQKGETGLLVQVTQMKFASACIFFLNKVFTFACNLSFSLLVSSTNVQNQLADTDIIQLVLAGNTQAYAQLVERYQNFVFTLVLRYLKSREDAEEVAQDVFVKAFRSLADFKGASKFSTWLYTITTTTSLSFLRKKKLAIKSLDDEKVFAAADTIDGGLSANGIEQKSKQRMVNDAINLLSPDDAQVISLFYKGEQTLEEIAQVMGKEPNAVKVQLHRARTRLKEKMQTHFAAEVKDIYNP